MNKKAIAFRVLLLVAGIVLLALGVSEKLDAFWSGMGGALIAVSVMRLVQMIRYEKNENYRKNVDTARNDERNQFLKAKAWSWAGYGFIMIAAVSTFLLKFAGREDLMKLASGSVGLLLVLFWISYFFLQKKY